MRIRILSDLHLEFLDWQAPAAPADVVVLAGDIDLGVRGVRWARENFAGTPIIYVPGNHEHYGGRLQEVLGALRTEADRHGVHFLEQGEVVIGNVRFLGATLWTDFALYGSEPGAVQRAMAHADLYVNDFRIVRDAGGGWFRAHHAREIHVQQTRWLAERLAAATGPTVVVTHHLPHPRSVHARFEADLLNASFASDLDRLVRPPVTLWIHGHTHDSMDYQVNGTRIVCNPRGYLPHSPNLAFDPTLVLELT